MARRCRTSHEEAISSNNFEMNIYGNTEAVIFLKWRSN